MEPGQIKAAREEAQRFLNKCDAAQNALSWKAFNDGKGGFWRNDDTSATAALKRASMDLTRALADLRRPS